MITCLLEDIEKYRIICKYCFMLPNERLFTNVLTNYKLLVKIIVEICTSLSIKTVIRLFSFRPLFFYAFNNGKKEDKFRGMPQRQRR